MSCNTAEAAQRVVETCELLPSHRSPNYDRVNDRGNGIGVMMMKGNKKLCDLKKT